MRSYTPYARLNASVAQASQLLDIVSLRSAVDALCGALAQGTYDPPPGCPAHVHYFPPMEKAHRAVCHEFAEDYELRSASLGGVDERSVVMWCPKRAPREPQEVRAQAEEEAALEEESRRLRAQEQALALEAARRAGAGAAGGGGGGRRAAAGRGGGAAEEEVIVAVPYLPKKVDKRTYEQVKQDLDSKPPSAAEGQLHAKKPRAAPGSQGQDRKEEDRQEEEGEEDEEIELERG